jgi:hypothetical protein
LFKASWADDDAWMSDDDEWKLLQKTKTKNKNKQNNVLLGRGIIFSLLITIFPHSFLFFLTYFYFSSLISWFHIKQEMR